MTDNELRKVVLKKFYEKREDGMFQPAVEESFSDLPWSDVARVCNQLGEHGLIEWQPVRHGGKTMGGVGQISAHGVDVYEGVESSALIKIDQSRNYNVSGSPFAQVGEGNTQDINISLGKLVAAINDSNVSEADKAEAKGLLKQLLEHPVVAAIVGGLAGKLPI